MKDKLKQGFDQATVSRGKRKGMLKTTCPQWEHMDRQYGKL